MLSLRSYTTATALHRHDFHQIVLPRQGALELEVMGRGGMVNAAQAAFIPSGADHAFHASGDNRFVVLDVPPSLLGPDKAAETLSRRTYFPLTPRLRHLLTFLEAGPDRLDGAVAGAWTTLLLASLVDEHGSPGGPDPRLRKAVAFVERQHAARIGVPDMAQAAGVSESRLHALFQAELRTSPKAFLTEYRLDRAISLLADPSLSIADVAILSGHYDQSALTRHLKASRHLTPAAYRRRLLGG